MSLKSTILKIANAAEEQFDHLKSKFRNQLALHQPIHIHPYRGFGTYSTLHVKGRVLLNANPPEPTDEDGYIDNLLNMYRFVHSREMTNVTIAAPLQRSDRFWRI